MACCGGGKGCNCKIEVTGGLGIQGSGAPDDPYVITGAAGSVQGVANTNFKVNVSGSGSESSPLTIETIYNTTAKLKNVPDVNIVGVTSGQVLAWDATNQKWINANPVTAPVGSVAHDGSLTGDGSGPNPLSVVSNAARGLTTSSSAGVGMRDTFVNQLVRKFNNATDRDAADPSAQVVNTLSIRNNAPGRVEFWDGTAWQPIDTGVETELDGAELLRLSGPWSEGMRLTHYVKELNAVVDSSGHFPVLGTAALTGRSGVLTATFQEGAQAPPFYAALYTDVGKVWGTARKATDGSLLANGTDVHGYVDAWMY